VSATGAAVGGLGVGNIGSFLPVAPLPSPVGAGPIAGNFGGIDVGPNGQVLVSYMDSGSGQGPSNVFVNLDPTGLGPAGLAPAAFNPAIIVPAPAVPAGSHTTTTNVGADLVINAQDDSIVAGVRLGIDALPRLAWDRSPKSAHQGRVYLVYTDSPAVGSQNTNIVLRSSDDNGATWSKPVQVNDDSGGASHFWPSLAVDPNNGDVAISWYDTRNDPGSVASPSDPDGEAPNDDSQVFGAVSSDGGNTFSASVQISIGSSSEDNVPQDPANKRDIDFGDYEGAAFANGFFYPAWADNSPALAGNPDLPNFDAATARIAVAQVFAAVPKVTATPPNLIEGQTFQGVIARFTDPDPNLTATDFTVTIDWADGPKPTIVTPTGDAMNGYVVRATHAYGEEGGYPVQVTVHDNVHDVSGSTTNALDISKLPGNQAEGTIAVNPKDTNQLFAASNEEGRGLFAAYSTDGGDAWTGRSMADGSDDLPVACCDPIAAFDQFGNLFLTYLDFTHKVIEVALSTDGGQSFTQLTTFTDPSGIDKPALAVGPGAGGKNGSVWVTYENDSPQHEISTAGAAVTAKGQIGPFSSPQGSIVDPGAQLAYLVVGPSGEVLLVYQSPAGGTGPSAIYASLDKDGGVGPGGFGAPVKVADTNVGGQLAIPAQAERKVHAGGNVAIDLSNGGNRGRIYVVYTNSPAVGSAATNIFVRFSDDDGKTWSDPVKVNDDTSQSSKFFPSIAVDQSSGNVGVAWYDTRNDPNNVKTQFFAAVGTEGGKGFSTNFQVSPGSSDATDPGLNDAGRINQYDDYSGLAFSQNVLYPLWADNSPGLQGNPDQPQFDQAVSKINVANISDAPITAQARDISADVHKESEELTAGLVSFTDADPNARPEVYTATIDWGDKTDPAMGTISQDGSEFVVSGKHAYEEEGSHTITVTIKDRGGASAMVKLVANIEDGKLTPPPTDMTINPAVDVPFSGTVATFTDSDQNGAPPDYQMSTIDWGDGTLTPAQFAYDGTAALTWTPDLGFLAIGNVSTGPGAGTLALFHLDLLKPADAVPLMGLPAQFHGGLAEDNQLHLYAISSNDNGESFLNLLNPFTPSIKQVAYLGLNFTGGLTFDSQDGNFYAIAEQGGTATLYAIDGQTFAVHPVASLGALTFGGLTYDSPSKIFYALANDIEGASTLFSIDFATGLKVTSLNIVGTGFTGGFTGANLIFSPTQGKRFSLFAISGDGSGSAVFDAINLEGPVFPIYEIGAQYNNGFDVIGSHTYGVKVPWTILADIKDVGGSTANAMTTAQVVDEAPVGLAQLPPFTAFQGFATGPVTLADFTIPGGAPIAANLFTARVNWGDDSASEAATVALTAGRLVVSSTGHTFLTAGLIEPTITLGDSGGVATVTDAVNVLPDVSRQIGGDFVWLPG
jgi:hypothetical protein